MGTFQSNKNPAKRNLRGNNVHLVIDTTCACGRPLVRRDETGAAHWNLCADCLELAAEAVELRRIEEAGGAGGRNDKGPSRRADCQLERCTNGCGYPCTETEVSKPKVKTAHRAARDVVCPWCGGTGRTRPGLGCGPCGGKGLVRSASFADVGVEA